jgi:drug/metabolite transporter (DMT)-like permease
VGEWVGVAIALVSSSLGGTAAAITRYLAGNTDPITLAILRWGIGFLCVLLATGLVGEPITANLVLGLVAVFAGIWIATSEIKKT